MWHIVSLARDNTCNSCHSQKACHFTQSLFSMTASFDNIKQCLANPPNCHIVAKYVQIKKGEVLTSISARSSVGAHVYAGSNQSLLLRRWVQHWPHDEIRNFKAGSWKKSAPAQTSKTTPPLPDRVGGCWIRVASFTSFTALRLSF